MDRHWGLLVDDCRCGGAGDRGLGGGAFLVDGGRGRSFGRGGLRDVQGELDIGGGAELGEFGGVPLEVVY